MPKFWVLFFIFMPEYVKLNLTVILICLFLITNEPEHLFLCIFAILVSSAEFVFFSFVVHLNFSSSTRNLESRRE